MKRIHLIMPMGGGGTRFGSRYHAPKPLIELQGKPFFYWAAQSVLRGVSVQDITFVVLREHIEQFRIDERIREFYPAAEICVLPRILNGAVLTCIEGVKTLDDNLPVLFNDCDHAFVCRCFEDFCAKGVFDEPDGALLTFSSDSNKFSYVNFNEEGTVCGTVEKEVVSNAAICGAYYFRTAMLFRENAEKYLRSCAYKEFFMSGVYNEMVTTGGIVETFPTDIHISFGTPEEYESVLQNEQIKAVME